MEKQPSELFDDILRQLRVEVLEQAEDRQRRDSGPLSVRVRGFVRQLQLILGRGMRLLDDVEKMEGDHARRGH